MVDVSANATTSAVLALKSVVGGEIEIQLDRDWYRMSLSAGVTYAIRMFGVGHDDNT